jgi:hypothetical protein
MPTVLLRFGLAALAVLAAAAIAALFVGGNAGAVRTPQAAPTDVVDTRFPPEWNGLEAVTELPATVPDTPGMELFGQSTFGYTTQEPLTAALMFSPPVYVPQSPGQAAMAAAIAVTPAPPARPRPDVRSPAVFNDAQIASIRDRLKLNRNQLRHWPAVERAMRALSWQKSNGQATLDTARVQQLQAAIATLVETLDENQKAELRMLAHIAGLGKVAAQF